AQCGSLGVPSSSPLQITASVRGAAPERPDAVTEVRGQVEVATTPGEIMSVRLEPADAPACPEALQAIAEADWVVLGPGSWYSSVIPHLLIPQMREALVATPAKILVNLNLQPQVGETEGFTPVDHYEVLLDHAPGIDIDVVLADAGSLGDATELAERVSGSGAQLIVDHIASGDAPDQHNPARLALAYARLMART
ncbi:MAG TPA: 2-phospho-L-lactate transferase CofD family protein, partial [Marmoricola sp.]|nr:2-phospho-L-lactate transferase CofD family protein [Marmoricola sp.]